MAFDVSLARGQFPAISKKEWILMDNAGGSQVPFQVADSVREYLLETNVQHGGTYELSKQAKGRVEDGRAVAAALLGAETNEIVFGPNISAMLRMLAIGLSELWDPDDEIIVSQAEHEANFGCWEYLEQFGMKIKVWEIDPETMTFDVSRLVDLVTDKTRCVAVHHASNVLGNVLPVEEVAKLTRGNDTYLVVDGGQYVPHRLPDVKSLGCDFYVYSGYKTFGPHLGVMYGKRDVLEAIPRWGHFFVDNDAVPAKFELGNLNYEGAAGLVGLEKYFRALGMDMQSPLRQVVTGVYDGIRKHETALTRDLLDFLARHPRVHVVGEGDSRIADERMPIVSFLVDDTDPFEFAQELEKERIGIRAGHFNSPRLLDALDLLEYKGVIRISLSHYNNENEMERLKKALAPLIS